MNQPLTRFSVYIRKVESANKTVYTIMSKTPFTCFWVSFIGIDYYLPLDTHKQSVSPVQFFGQGDIFFVNYYPLLQSSLQSSQSFS